MSYLESSTWKIEKAILPFFGSESSAPAGASEHKTQHAATASVTPTRLMAPPFIGQRHSTHADCCLAIPRGGTSAVKRVASYPSPPNLITGASERRSRQVLRPADNKPRLSTAGFAPLLLCLLYPD